ncbi:MAG: LysR family transcriptional regulator [Rhodocyclaceae bacterium]|nr:MAG: LysR family transcriptional regulator [Rhodocyclaceae bacterium]
MKLIEDLSRINLETIKLFERVAGRGSIAAAARELGISPSMATRKLSSLEQVLGVRLFQRTTRSMKLSEAGAVALDCARKTLDAFEVAFDDLASMAEKPAGRIRIAVNHYAANILMPALLARFCASYPDITISIVTTDALVNQIDNEFDLVIHTGRIPDSSVIGVRVVEFHRILCAAPSYIERYGMPMSLEDLASHGCLVHSVNEPTNWFFRKDGKLITQAVKARVESDNFLMIREMARQGLGIARVREDTLASDLSAGRLVQVLPDYQCVYSNGELPGLWITYPNRRVLYRVRLLIDFLQKEIPLANIGG